MTAIRSLLSPASSPPPVRRNAPPESSEPRGRSSLSSLVLDRTRRGELPQALELFLQLQRSGWPADEFALARLLKSCSALPDARRLGEQLHAKSVRAGLSSERGVRTSLVAMYSAAGRLADARQVFDEVPVREETDVPTWNAVISAYAFHGSFLDCFLSFRAMLEQLARLALTDATFAILISACAASQQVAVGKAIHAMALKNQSLDATKTLNSLISMYAKLGFLGDALKVFDAMSPKDVVSWNAIISGLEQNGEFDAAISIFRRMSVKPNRITCLSLLSAIASALSLRLGKEVHAWLIRSGLDSETAIGNSLIAMYGKCSDVDKGRMVFEMLPCPDVISWNSMLSGYAQSNEFVGFHQVFEEMQSSGLSPDLHTLTILLCALSPDSSVSCKPGREIHGYLLRREAELPVSVSAYNALLSMYLNFGRICDAEKVFKGLDEPDSFTFNSMIDGLSNNGLCRDAMALFVEMHTQGFPLEFTTLSIVLTVCSKMVSVELGKQLHAFPVKQYLRASLSVDNALVSMYSKCGSLSDAIRVFQRMEKRDVVSWTAMITGCAHHGAAKESVEFFDEMRNNGIPPNSVTYLGLLTACAHAGLVEEGKQCFGLLIKDCISEPSIDHYACMVDLFSRSGQFKQSEAIVQLATSRMKPDSEPCLRLRKVLLGACHSHRQLDLGISIGLMILDSNPDDETTHVLLSNLYAAVGLWNDAVSIRRLMRGKGLKKEAGCSWVEMGNRKHVFVAADVFHEKRKEIYEKLDELDDNCRRFGYVPATKYVLHDVDEVQKEAILRNHSERLAVSFALLSSTSKAKRVVRVIKNLRVCEDCHEWMKFACQVEGVEIVLRDSRRFHSFREGKCSCGDYW